MFACLFQAARIAPEADSLPQLAREFSPRVETHGDRLVLLDVSGLGRLLGDARAIGAEIRRAAADRGLHLHVALAATRVAALLMARGRGGLTIVEPGEEAIRLAPLPLRLLEIFYPPATPTPPRGPRTRRGASARHYRMAPHPEGGADPAPRAGRAVEARAELPRALPDGAFDAILTTLSRWGLETLGDVAALPAPDLFERLGETGLDLQRLARGEDRRPLVPDPGEERFEASLELEWPIEGLEPLSFVLGRLLDPLCAHLERRDRGAAVLRLRLRLVTRDVHERALELPAPFRDPRVLRTLLLLDLEGHPPPAGIDAIALAVDPAPGRIVQPSLLERAMPSAEDLSTLLARLTALMGEGRSGAPTVLDSYLPGAFGLAPFRGPDAPRGAVVAQPAAPSLALRRFRRPVAARVSVERGRPARVSADRGAIAGRVVSSAGPWRSSGHWWNAGDPRARERPPWNRDEWDVALDEGGVYRLYRDREDDRWYVEAMVD
jgi:protein ImuB